MASQPVDTAALGAAQAAQADLQRRLLTLLGASTSLVGTPDLDVVLSGTMALARELVAADAYALWRLDARSHLWTVVASWGLSDEFTRPVSIPPAVPLAFGEPLVLEDVDAAPLVESRRQAYRLEGVRSMLVMPLLIRDQITGTLVLYCRSPHVFSDTEVQTVRALSSIAAGAMTTAELYEEQRRSRDRSNFLDQVTATLATSLDYHATLKTTASLAVPQIADWCAVDILDEAGHIERLAVVHIDPQKVALALEFQQRFPEDPDAPSRVWSVVRTGKSVLVPHLSDEMLVTSLSHDPDRLAAVRALGIVSFMCVPLLTQGRTVGAITFASTQSQRQFTEADVRFAEQVAARAAMAVENARVYEQARTANRVKDEFLATLSHELRTPLNAILGYARMLRSGIVPQDNLSRALEIVERNATSLNQIVADVLDVSRIISGKMRLTLHPVDLALVVQQAVDTVLPTAQAKGVTLEANITSTELVSGDADRLQQVVWNLLSNAVKFTPRGGRVEVRLARINSDVALEVRDTGIGIAPSFLPHIFERFRQADSRFAREHSGLGLGLAITRHIVEMHGGTIEAESEGDGRGATFRVHIPALAAAPQSVGAPRRVREEPTRQSRRLTGLHVLAVDDDEDALGLVRDVLESAGARVTTARSALEALDSLQQGAPDVLVADLGMPALDGFELIRRVRELPKAELRSNTAAALTAYARPEDRASALQSGYQIHLPKPIDPVELVVTVAVLARRGEGAR